MIRLITNVVGMICPLKQTGPSTDFVDGPENSKKCSLNWTNVIYFTTNACVVKQPSLKDNSSSRITLKSVMLMADQNGKIEPRGCPTKRVQTLGILRRFQAFSTPEPFFNWTVSPSSPQRRYPFYVRRGLRKPLARLL